MGSARAELAAELAAAAAEVQGALPQNTPDAVREALAALPLELFTRQYERLSTEIGQQLARRQAAMDRFLTVLGGASALIVATWTAAQAVGQPLIGLYGTAGVALLVPVLVFSAAVEHQHADLRIGQHAAWIARHHEPLLPASVAWDTSRRAAFPERGWFEQDGAPGLAQPRGWQLLGLRMLIGVVDGIALVTGATTVIAAGLVGPWWTVLLAVPFVAVLVGAAGLSWVALRMTIHAR